MSDVQDALSQVTMVDGFGTARAAQLGELHASIPRHPTRTPDADVLGGLRRAAEDALKRATTPDDTDRVEKACEVMHDAYEAAAPQAGWATQAASRKPWADVPEPNKATMRVAVRALIEWLENR